MTQNFLYVNMDVVLQEPGSEVYKKALEMTQKAIILFPKVVCLLSAPPMLMCIILYVAGPCAAR